MVRALVVDPSLDSQHFTILTAARAPIQSSVQNIDGLPAGSNVGDLLQWDGSQWITVAGGGVAGDVLTFDGSVWAPAAATGVTAWDHVVESTADLPAPAAGVITLTSGSWAFKAGVDVGANVVLVPGGSNVLIKGMGYGKVLTGSAAAVLQVEGTLAVESLAVTASAGAGMLINGGTVQSNANRWDAQLGVQAVRMDGGLFWDSQSRYLGGTDGFFIQGGEAHLQQCQLLAGSQHGLQGDTANVQKLTLFDCLVSATADTAALWNCTQCETWFIGTEVFCSQSNGTCIEVTAADTLQFVGGKWRTQNASRGNGLVLNGNVTGGVQVIGVHGETISSGDVTGEAFILYVSGTIRRATVQGCNTATDVLTAINWPAASIPTLGLSIVGNMWDDPNPYVGFGPATARVNCKANMDAGGLMTETAIVP